MKLEDNITESITRVCDEYGKAIERYDYCTGGEQPPEQFIASYVVSGLADVLTMTAETNSRKLWEWNQESKFRHSQQPTLHIIQDYISKFGHKRVDLVIYMGDHTKKSEMGFLCLVEFKYGWRGNADFIRLTEWLPFIDTCRYGAICTAIEIPQNSKYITEFEQAALEEKRILVLGRIARPLWSKQSWQTYAEIFENPQFGK